MQLTTWRPFQEMDDLFRRYARQADRRLPASGEQGSENAEWSPSADITETTSEYVVKAELPEVERDDIHVSLNEGTLSISGERKYHEDEKDEKVHRIESFYGRFSRVFSVPSNVDSAKINAKYKDGVLRVRLPKTQESAPEEPKEVKVS